MNKELKSLVQQKLAGYFPGIKNLKAYAIGGGSINETYQLQFDNRKMFCKANGATKFPELFKSEKNGLKLIGAQGVIRVPKVIDCFVTGSYQAILMEWIEEGERTEAFWKRFGAQLAALHQKSNIRFGLTEDNYMGNLPQENGQQENWIEFFTLQRLQPMIDKCCKQKLLTVHHQKQFELLIEKLPQFFAQTESPSLLHGDLLCGNFICAKDGHPVLIDPAVYYGHRSMDIGMTTLFGGFDKTFYEAYNYNFPFPEQYKEQWSICNLYPLLIHLVLFGGSYLQRIEQTLLKFC